MHIQRYNNHYLPIFITLFLVSFWAKAQSGKVWAIQQKSISLQESQKHSGGILPSKYQVYQLQKNNFVSQLSTRSSSVKQVVTFPNEKGEEEPFEVVKSDVLSLELQEKYPRLSSYKGKSKWSHKTVYFSVSPYGVNATFNELDKAPVYIDAIGKKYIRYSAKDARNDDTFACETIGKVEEYDHKHAKNILRRGNNDNQLRTFKLALATTGEYAQFHLNALGISNSATISEKKEAVLSEVQKAITRVNSIYERELSIHLQLVDNTDLLIFLDPSTDGFTNDDGYKIVTNESKPIFDKIVGFDNYDIGHTFTTGAGGVAFVGSVCKDNKNQGATGMKNPIGDPFYVDYVAHEIGHQLGATHTFNGLGGFCTIKTRERLTAYEPGSGSTIMAYAGICEPQNVQKNTDSYFHYISITQIMYLVTPLSCPSSSIINNEAPVIQPLATYTLPISTPFALTAEATDNENDSLTYTWEQMDREIVSVPLQSSYTKGPAFRSIKPSLDATRYFPNLETVINNQLRNDWEVLPSVSRSMSFIATIRDNHIGGGRTTSLQTNISFTGEAGPFKVISQPTYEKWKGGSLQTITWDVANTDKDPVNCDKVSILFSEDGGYTYSHTLLEEAPNTGLAVIFAPNVDTKGGRIKVKSIDNVFYAINKAELEVEKSVLDPNVKFIVRTQNQTCPDSNDGMISILAERPADYTTTIAGKTYKFTRSLVLYNVAAGDYDFCISAPNINQKCFQKKVLGSAFIKVQQIGEYPKAKYSIQQGTPPYQIFLNGEKIAETKETTFEKEILNGDVIKIKTSLDCEGTYEKEFIAFEDIRAFSNPTSGLCKISVPKTALQKVEVNLYDFTGKLISQKLYPVVVKRISLDIRHLSAGIYIAVVKTEDEEKSIKIVKE